MRWKGKLESIISTILYIFTGITLCFVLLILGALARVNLSPTPPLTYLPFPTLDPFETPTVFKTAIATEIIEEAGPLDPFISTGRENNPQLDRSRLRVGQLTVEYPLNITVNTSETVAIEIFIPDDTEDLPISNFSRISLPLNDPQEIFLFSYSDYIPVYETMRATIKSTSFKIEPLQVDEPQPVNIDTANESTRWEWIIQGPDYPGEQVIAVSTYLGNDTQPSWVGSFKINVITPTETPIPTFTNTPKPATPTITPSPSSTPTPIPDIVIIKTKIVESVSLEVCLGIPAVLIVILSLYDQIKKRLKKKKSTPKKK